MKKLMLFLAIALAAICLMSCEQKVDAKTYIVSFDANGADSGATPSDILAKEGESIKAPSQGTLSKEGYDFVGWNTKLDGTGTSCPEAQFITVYKNFTLYAQWRPHTYFISYDLNGGTLPAGMNNVCEYTIETDTFALINPEKEGYKFEGWKTASNTEPNKNTVVNKGTVGYLTFVAVWKEFDSYPISYNSNGGEGTIDTAYKYEGQTIEIALDEGIAKKGYTFAGWNTASDGTGTDYSPNDEYSADENLTLYAKWDVVEYTISYDLGVGELPTGKTNPEKYTVETGTFTLVNPEKDLYEFKGWKLKDSADSTAKVACTIEKGTTGNLTYVAVWRPLGTFSVSYDANGGEGTIDTAYKYEGQTIEIASDEGITRKGYTFAGWNTASDGTGTDYSPNDEYKVDADLTLYAKWTTVKYSIQYSLDGGAISEDANLTEYTIESDTFTLPIPTKTEYEFLGWKAEESDEPQKMISIEKGSTGNLAFTATWRQLNRYSISYNVNEGSGSVESQSRLEGTSIAIAESAGIERTGYTFVCWNTKKDGSGTDYNPSDEYRNDEDLELFAKWSPVEYSITYVLAGGTLPEGKSNPESYTIGTGTFELTNPERKGYVFVGWKVSSLAGESVEKNVSISKGSSGDKSFTAVWKEATKYAVTFNANGADGGSVPNTLAVYDGDSFSVPLSGSLYKDGYAFYGWKTALDEDEILYKPNEDVVVSKDIMLYAVWNTSPLVYTYLSATDSYSVKCNDQNVVAVVIPSTYNEKPVSCIESAAFVNCSNLTSITIPDSVTIIGSSAFGGCRGLTSITIPNSVTSIESWSFERCSGLANITIPSGVTSIGDYAFENCSGLTSITISDSVTSIGRFAFSGCSGLTSITIPKNVTSIGSSAFYRCNNLTIVFEEGMTEIPYKALYDATEVISVSIPSSVTSIGEYAFYWCRNLSSITIPDSVTSIGRFAFYGCSSLTSITIPDGVTSIGIYSFSGCSGLTSITIPKGVTSIASSAFRSCLGIESIEVDSENSEYYVDENCLIERKSKKLILGCKSSTIPSGITSIGDYAFDGCDSFTSLEIPEGVKTIGAYAFGGCYKLTELTIPSSVIKIDSYAFSGCKNLSIVFAEGTTMVPAGTFQTWTDSTITSVTIPSSVTSIGAYAFGGCQSLKKVTMPSSLTSIGNYAFYGCSGLTSITIPKGVTSIGSSVFTGCKNLSIVFEEGTTTIPSGTVTSYLYDGSPIISVTIPESVTSIGDYAFCSFENLTEIIMPKGVTSIGDGAFYGCKKLTSVTIPEGVTSIGNSVFSGCSGLTSVTIPEGVTSIGNSVFSGCSGLTSITIPDSVTAIGEDAFNGCKKLTSITIPEDVISIGNYAFENCTGLTSITIPEGVTSIGNYAFYGCNGLTSITIPEGVTSIGNYAFYGCSGLTSITIPASVTSIGNYAFSGCSGLTSITIPSSVTSIGKYAFSGCNNLTVVFEEGITKIPSNALSGVSGVVSISIPSSVTSIGEYAFYYCRGLTSITIPDSVTSIGSGAFYGCSGLTSITIPESVTRIGSSAFKDCTGLTSITIPEGVMSIGNYTFYGCNGLTSITIPSSVTSISYYAFYGCRGLTSITIPEGVTSIGSYAFSGCSGLADITFSGTTEQWSSITKGSNWNSNTGNYTIHCTDGDIAK